MTTIDELFAEKPTWLDCLEFLMAMPVGASNLYDAATNGDAAAIENAGMILLDGWLTVPPKSDALQRHFANTGYRDGIWVMAMRDMPEEHGQAERFEIFEDGRTKERWRAKLKVDALPHPADLT